MHYQRKLIEFCKQMKYAAAGISFGGILMYAAGADYIWNTGIHTEIPAFALGVIIVGAGATVYFGMKELLLKERYRNRIRTLKMRSELGTHRSA